MTINCNLCVDRLLPPPFDQRFDVERVDHAEHGQATTEQHHVDAVTVPHAEHSVVHPTVALLRHGWIPLRLEVPEAAELFRIVHADVNRLTPIIAVTEPHDAGPITDREILSGEAAGMCGEYEVLQRHRSRQSLALSGEHHFDMPPIGKMHDTGAIGEPRQLMVGVLEDEVVVRQPQRLCDPATL